MVGGNHQGQRSNVPRQQAGHKTASDNNSITKKDLQKGSHPHRTYYRFRFGLLSRLRHACHHCFVPGVGRRGRLSLRFGLPLRYLENASRSFHSVPVSVKPLITDELGFVPLSVNFKGPKQVDSQHFLRIQNTVNEPPRVYRRVKLSKDGPYDTEETHTDLHG